VTANQKGLANPGRRAPMPNPAIRNPAAHRRAHRLRQINRSTNLGHGGHREISLPNQIERQPRNEEIQRVISAKKRGESSPSRTLSKDLPDSGTWPSLLSPRYSGSPRHPPKPWSQPQQAGQAEDNKERAPSEPPHQNTAGQHAE